AVAAGVERVVMAGSNCALRHGYRISQIPFPFQALSIDASHAQHHNARREVLDWDDTPIPRLYAAGEICSVFQFVYQGGGKRAECVVLGRIAGQNAAAAVPLETASNPH